MQILGSVVVVCGLIAMTNAVCAPSSWEGVELGKIGIETADGKPGQLLTLVSNVSSDYDRLMEVSHQTISSETEGWSKEQSIYIDYKARMMYTADPKARTCVRQAYNATMIKYCSDNPMLQHVTSLEIDNQMADIYDVDNGIYQATLTFLRDSFIPVTAISESNANGMRQFVAISLGNVTAAVADNKVFELPDYCGQQQQVMTEMLCKAEQFQSFQIGKVAREDGRVFNLKLDAYYDTKREIEVVHETVYTQNGTFDVNVHLDYKNHIQHVYTPALNSCKRSALNFTMERFCRDNPNLMYRESLKLPKTMADIYTLQDYNRRVTLTMSRNNFVPVSSVIEGNFEGVNQIIALQHGNYTTTVKDDKIFDIPAGCAN